MRHHSRPFRGGAAPRTDTACRHINSSRRIGQFGGTYTKYTILAPISLYCSVGFPLDSQDGTTGAPGDSEHKHDPLQGRLTQQQDPWLGPEAPLAPGLPSRATGSDGTAPATTTPVTAGRGRGSDDGDAGPARGMGVDHELLPPEPIYQPQSTPLTEW